VCARNRKGGLKPGHLLRPLAPWVAQRGGRKIGVRTNEIYPSLTKGGYSAAAKNSRLEDLHRDRGTKKKTASKGGGGNFRR